MTEISSVAELKRRLVAGECFKATFRSRILWFFFVEEGGWARRETDLDGSDGHTQFACHDEMRAALRYADLETVHEDVITMLHGVDDE